MMLAQQGNVPNEPDHDYRGGLVMPPLPKPRFILTDTSGAPFDFWNRTQGQSRSSFSAIRIVRISVQCTWRISAWHLKRLPAGIADQVKLVFVTTDPARDTPVELRRWLDNFDKHFVGLTGTEAALEAVQKAAGVPPAQQDETRATATIQLRMPTLLSRTPKTIWRHVIYPGGVSKDDWVHDLPLLIKETWGRP